ncbi:MAG: SDR family NAD(P)-dependent oxidoreductase [Bacteroidales bacterium]|nr:SDR family NAD(P)-dependent oxidoreductase [Bacteroidales bacterium]MBN2699657.1 SDR family NAD(P)-dependent oxidoreductase [Bacteroidales bacterium]
MTTQRCILITGASGGLASAAIDLLTRFNYHVFAADINPEVVERYRDNPFVSALVMDVTDSDAVKKAYDTIAGEATGLDAVIHLAGKLAVGSVAEMPVEDARNILDVNLIGVYNVNKQFLSLVLNRKGRIIIISSENARQTAVPFNGIYALSKYALEAYSDALRRELAFHGVRVIKVRPGPFKTPMTRSTVVLFAETEKQSMLFKRNIAKGSGYLPGVYEKAHDPALMAKRILKIIQSRNPRTAYNIKHDIPRTLLELLPVRWADALVKRVLG